MTWPQSSAGHAVATTFRIRVGGGAAPEGGGASAKPQGKQAFTQQLKRAGRHAAMARLARWA